MTRPMLVISNRASRFIARRTGAAGLERRQGPSRVAVGVMRRRLTGSSSVTMGIQINKSECANGRKVLKSITALMRNQLTAPLAWTAFVSIAAALVGAYLGAYFGKKAEHRADREDFRQIGGSDHTDVRNRKGQQFDCGGIDPSDGHLRKRHPHLRGETRADR